MESDIQFEIDNDFFQEEVRCGHTVTTDMKKLWYMEMCCMRELQRICKKHNIRYFAGDGTLLGAVRHGGFIPWDDDMDVYMLPEDYDKFCKVAPAEIQSPFFFQHCSTQRGYGSAMSRIRNSDTTACTMFEWNIMDPDYNLGVFVDIFPLHYVEPNRLKRGVQNLKRLFFSILLSGCFCEKQRERKERSDRKWGTRKKICFLAWRFLKLFLSFEKLSKKFFDTCSACKKSDQVAPITFSGFSDKYVWKFEWFRESVDMPFEDMLISVPKNYHEILKKEYGDYMKFEKGTQIHTMVVFDPDTPYSIKLKDFY